MPRAIWNGVITFGIVSIPVKLYAATESKDVSFNQLHRECHSRIKQRRWCPVCEREVDNEEIVKGYQYAKDQYVVLTDDDFERLPVASKHTIQLAAFVEAKEIDPVFHEKSYYLEPDEVGLKPFALLMRALKMKELTALANIAIRQKERLCALRSFNGTMMLDTLYYPDEIRIERHRQLPEEQVPERELQMALSLIDLLSDEFDPQKYHDNYREALMEVIEAKLQGAEVVEAAPAPATNVTDLMAALKASVDAVKKRKESEAQEGAETKRGKAAVA
ncbi:MAG TPA: Ku protein [Chloroflexota bacterium]|nr:Ku protein [Chloroflexota bacterium]